MGESHPSQTSGHGPRSLGAARLRQFVEAAGLVGAEVQFLTMAIGFAGQADYSDEALDGVISQAGDLEEAARQLAHFSRRLAEEWRAQRQEVRE